MTCLRLGRNPNGLRVLIVAEHASARFGGEAILPLHYFRLLRRRGVDTRLIVHARTRNELAELFPSDLGRIYYVPDTRLHLLLHRMGHRLPSAIRHITTEWLSRLLSQLMARRIAHRVIRRHRIDVVHQPIPVSPMETSLLCDLGVPIVIGPMNGAMTFPPGFGHEHGAGAGRLLYLLARRASDSMHRFFPGKLKADVLVVANERTRRGLPRLARGRVVTLVENGVDLSLWQPRVEGESEDQPVRFVFAGRLVDWKAVDLLIEAFKPLPAQIPSTLDLLGDGPERSRLERQVQEAGLDIAVRFHGWQSQAKCARLLRSSDVFVIPSLFECGGAVVLEAMAAALPVVATAWGGPTDYIHETCGILVPPKSRDQLIAGLRDAMIRLARSPRLRRAMGSAGRRRAVESFDWERKIDQMLQIYTKAVARSATNRSTLPPAGEARRTARAPASVSLAQMSVRKEPSDD